LAGFKLELGGEEEEAAAAVAREEVEAPGRQQDTRCAAIWMGEPAQGRCRSRGGEGRRPRENNHPPGPKQANFGIVGLGWAGLAFL